MCSWVYLEMVVRFTQSEYLYFSQSVLVPYRRLPGPQLGHHDWCSSPPDRFRQHDGEPVLPVDLLQTSHQNHELWLAQIRWGWEMSGWTEWGKRMNNLVHYSLIHKFKESLNNRRLVETALQKRSFSNTTDFNNNKPWQQQACPICGHSFRCRLLYFSVFCCVFGTCCKICGRQQTRS